MFFILISKLQRSKYLPGDFQSNMDCLSTGPQVVSIAGASLIVLAGVSAFLTASIEALAASVAACIMAFLSYFLSDFFLESAYFLPISL